MRRRICLNLFVPFYAYYWLYTRNYQLALDAYHRGETMKDSSISCLIWAILGMPVISLAILQNNMNHYTEMKQFVTSSQNVTSAPSPLPKEKLSELQDLLASGLITQADYDKKKEEILENLDKSEVVTSTPETAVPDLIPPTKKAWQASLRYL